MARVSVVIDDGTVALAQVWIAADPAAEDQADTAGAAAVVAPAEVDDDFAVDPDPRPLPLPVPGRSLVVLHRGRYAGAVSYIPVVHGPSYPCSAWLIGAYVAQDHRGYGVGAAAQRLLVRHLFDTTDLDRVEAETDVENVAEQRALERAGLRREGVARGAQLRGGVRRDVVRYAILRSDPWATD